MQTSDAIENRAGCTCRIEPIEPRGWRRIGDTCSFCKAWHIAVVTGSMEPLREYGYGLKREDGTAQKYGGAGDDQEE